ncbi:MAG TPA: D-glycero-beta-D-manno-heptose 1-phosphate adenylyltransferase [Longimicrobiales bacterium]|nr:D-glycero-beta-D-manno-heptose 1-phosphate adenylyltransferase [Longimicrobiales bacterium]
MTPEAGRPPGPEEALGHKILDRNDFVARFGRPRDGRLVFTNGCFDLLHPGHVLYLARARALGEALVVGLNTDASVRRLKGPGRPLVPQDDRALVLAALASVDAVTLFGEDTPAHLIEALLPDVLVKGGDYDLADVVGREAVEAAGGSVAVIPFIEGYSTTSLVERIRRLDR